MTARLTALLSALKKHDIEFIIVGGMAAVLHGAPLATQDLDIVHRKTDDNIDKLIAFLNAVNARYRGQPQGRVLFPSRAALAGSGHNNLMTEMGPLDLLCELAEGQGYDELLPFSEEMTNNTGMMIRVVSLKKLIEIKAETGRPKDQLAIPILMKLSERKSS